MTVLEKRKPSTDLIQMIKVAGDSLLSFGKLWGSIKAKGESEGFSEKELQEMLRPYLKEKLDSKKIWYLFNKEEHNQKSAENYQKRTINRTIDVEKVIEQSPISEELPPNAPTKTSEQFYKEQEEEPTDSQAHLIEYQKEKITELEYALHQIKQFKPATEITDLHPVREEPLTDEICFQWLEKKDNGVNCYWFPNYGIELFRNRILTDLKGRGVKTFKRLYFEV